MAEPSSGAKRQQPVWRQPTTSASNSHELMLYNSLTRRKDLFIPEDGRRVNWYICGPTVYDSAHMGHARAYISFDILRRVLQSYFGYDVRYVMNVTDVDDKIIKRARQKHLFEEYMKSNRLVNKVVDDVMAALNVLQKRFAAETNDDKKKMLDTMVHKVESAVDQLLKAIESGVSPSIDAAKENLLVEGRDVLSDWLDSSHGAECTDHSIFSKLARYFEAEFHRDMNALNVLPADVLTRVSEYLPEIIAFIEQIIANGFAYEAGGSVYFDPQAFDNSKDHHYAKLVPEAYGDASTLTDSLREGEGELSIGEERLKEKRSPHDFALWKASKPGEPYWSSPWGPGRPGWHIECSVMASEICGSKLDIHSGGFDLKFPHHDNEIAQTEACFGHDQWVNYFLHAGTLRIEGLKMSKSLKNFITIREALKTYTARQIRLLFLLHNWSDTLDYGSNGMSRALCFEKMANEFFLLVRHIIRQKFSPEKSETYAKWSKWELDLDQKFSTAKLNVHKALCDNIDARSALEAIRELISHANSYYNKTGTDKCSCVLLRNIALYVTNLLRIFGAIEEGGPEIGFSEPGSEGQSAQTKEDEVMPYLNTLAKFRERIRAIAITHKQTEILTECDDLRDNVLPDLGVRLEDRETETMIKLADRETLLREKEQRIQLAAAKKAEMEKRKAEAAEKEAKKRIPPSEMFKTVEYSQWDDQGVPTHDAKGEAISVKQRKKLEKQWETQQKKYEEIMAKEGNSSGKLANAADAKRSHTNGIVMNGSVNGHGR